MTWWYDSESYNNWCCIMQIVLFDTLEVSNSSTVVHKQVFAHYHQLQYAIVWYSMYDLCFDLFELYPEPWIELPSQKQDREFHATWRLMPCSVKFAELFNSAAPITPSAKLATAFQFNNKKCLSTDMNHVRWLCCYSCHTTMVDAELVSYFLIAIQ